MRTTAVLIALLSFAAIYAQDESFPSGPKAGEALGEFKVVHFSGPDAGKEAQLYKKSQGPALVVFVHKITRPALQFMKPVDKYASELADDKLQSHFVWLTDDKEETEKFLNRAKNSLNLQSTLSICLDGGKDGPASYGLNDKVTLTVLLSKDGKVVSNFALVDPSGADAGKVLDAMAKLMGKKRP